ncbi:hypothetical protein HMPREF1246_1803 [Acidaminococcus sp. BV3L6]|nr:hypothetical protein HMPREF1246_1803 [Acidaminococcus sp. BV3L6]
MVKIAIFLRKLIVPLIDLLLVFLQSPMVFFSFIHFFSFQIVK